MGKEPLGTIKLGSRVCADRKGKKKKKGICYINETTSIHVVEGSAHFIKHSFKEVHL